MDKITEGIGPFRIWNNDTQSYYQVNGHDQTFPTEPQAEQFMNRIINTHSVGMKVVGADHDPS